jgi:hypothetical protein
MPREQFAHQETPELFKTLENTARVSGVSRGQAFEDFLHMSVCALAGGTMEEQYLGVVAKHTVGEKGSRGCDLIAKMFAQLVTLMEETRKDILGDLFQGAITYGNAGQFYTPEPITELIVRLTVGDLANDSQPKTVCDPCCGSGRMLMAAAEKQPRWTFVGQDIDLRCVRMTAINLALWNRRGYVIWGDTLAGEQKLVYQTGLNLRGFVRELAIAESAPVVRHVAAATKAAVSQTLASSESPDDSSASNPKRQLFLFDSAE